MSDSSENKNNTTRMVSQLGKIVTELQKTEIHIILLRSEVRHLETTIARLAENQGVKLENLSDSRNRAYETVMPELMNEWLEAQNMLKKTGLVAWDECDD